ncbi:hypothetical protein YC2023_084302 [Brassica napus]
MHEKGLESLRKDEVVHSNSGGLYGYHTHHKVKRSLDWEWRDESIKERERYVGRGALSTFLHLKSHSLF